MKAFSEEINNAFGYAIETEDTVLFDALASRFCTESQKLKDELPAYIDGLAEGLGKRAEDIEKTLEKILSDKKLEKSLENLGEQIQKIASDEKLGKAIEDFGKKLEGLLENKELEKSLEDLGKRLEDLFGSFSGEEPAQEEMK